MSSPTLLNVSSIFTPTKTFGNSSPLDNVAMRNSTAQVSHSLRSGGSSRPSVYPMHSAQVSVTGPIGNRTSGHSHLIHASGLYQASHKNSSFASGHAKKTGAVPQSITSLPRPTAYLSGTPIWPSNATLPPGHDSGIMGLLDNNYCTMGQSCATCSNYNAQSCSCANSVSKWFDDNKHTTVTTRTCFSSYYGKIPGTTQPQTCFLTTLVQPIESYKAPAKCCDKCNIRAAEVQVIFWSDSDKSIVTKGGRNATITTLSATERVIDESTLVSGGFTFLSPSVYVSYNSLQASISCVTTKMAAAAWTGMGPVHNTIRAYDPGALSRAKCFGPDVDGLYLGYQFPDGFSLGTHNGWERFHYQELLTPPPEEELISRYQTCFNPPLKTKIPGSAASAIHAYPRLSIPKDVTDIDTLWKSWGRGTCTPVGLGAMDPPRALTKKSIMVPVVATTTAQDGASGQTAVPALPAAGPSDPAEAVETKTSAAVSPSTQEDESSSEPSSTPSPPLPPDSIVTTSSPIVDPIGTLDPNDPGLSWAGQDHGSSQPEPISESATEKPDPGQAPSPLPAAVPQPEQQASPTPATKVLESQNNVQQSVPYSPQISAGQSGNMKPNNAPIIDPNSIPITLSPTNSTPAPQASPNPSANDIAHFIAQGFLGGQPQPPSSPGSQPPLNGQIAQNDGSGSNLGGNVPANAPGVSSHVEPGVVNNAPATNGVGQNAPPTAASPNLILGNNQIVQSSNGGLQIGGQTLVPGSQATVSGQIIDHPNPSTLVANGKTYNVIPVSGSNPLVIGNQPVQRGSSGAVIVADTTVQPDQPATISGHTYSLAGSSNVVVDQNTYALPPSENAYLIQAQPTPTQNSPVNSQVTLANGVVVRPQVAIPSSPSSGASQVYAFPNGEAASVGGNPIIVYGTTYSALPSNQGFLVNGASTLPILAPSPGIRSLFSIGSQVVTAAPSGLILPSATVSPGGPAVTISGTPVSLDASSHLYVGSSVADLGAEPKTSSLFVGSEVITPAPGGFTVGGMTITPGGPATIISGTEVSLDASSHLYVGSSTISLSAGGAQSPLTVGSETITPAPTGFVLPSGSVSPNGPAVTISGTVLSLDASSHLQVGNSVMTLSDVPSVTSSIFTVGTETFTANPTGFNIGSMRVTPGGAASIVAGTTVSLAQDGRLILGTSTLALAPPPMQSVFAVGSETFTANPTGFAIGSVTMTHGGPGEVVAGTTLSLEQNGMLVLGTKTLSLYPMTSQSIFTVGTETFTANPTGFPIASASLIPGGPAITIADTVVSLEQNGLLVIGSNTMTLPSSTGSVSTTPTKVVVTSVLRSSGTPLESATTSANMNAGIAAGPSLTAANGEDLADDKSSSSGVTHGHGNAAMKGIIWDWNIIIAVWTFIVALKAVEGSL